MNITLIGTGWLGLPLATQLAQTHTVWASTRSARAALPGEPFTRFVYPSETPETVAALAAADVLVLAFPPDRSVANGYATTCNHLAAAVSKQCKVLLISSTGVYPDTLTDATEDSISPQDFPEHPILQAEMQLRNALGDRLTVLRLAGLIGPNRYPALAMSRSGKTYEAGEPVNVLHLDDAVGLAVHLIENERWGTTMNGCAAGHPARGDYYTWMAEKLGVPAPLFRQTTSGGKVIASERSRKSGYVYRKDDPYAFL